MKILFSFIGCTALILSACDRNNAEADAFGSFEATEITVSAESNGRILRMEVTRGTNVTAGDEIALTDTTMLHLQRNELEAAMAGVAVRTRSVNAQNEILKQQMANLSVNLERVGNMLRDEAATQKQYDDLKGQMEVLEKQVAANNVQKSAISAELEVFTAKKMLIDEQLNRCLVRSPISGTVIEKYAEAGELTSPGRPLVKVADLTVMKLRVYVSGAQLGDLRLGETCTVRIDEGEKGYRSYTGTITHIASKAEFTPKIIQTKESRVTLVYAVTIEVPNDGSLKSGMPGEVLFKDHAEGN